MSKRPHFLFFIALSILTLNILFLGACKKDVKTYSIAGAVSDPQLHSKVSSAKVSLKASKVQSGVYNPNYVEIDSYTTSSDGKFSFSVKHDNVSGYRIDITKNKYFDASIDLKTENVQNNGLTNISLDLIPIGEITLIVKNTTPQTADDNIKFRFSNVAVQGKDCWTNSATEGIGPSYNLTKTGKVSGNKEMYLEWIVTKKGNQHIYKDTIWSEAFKTVTYHINY
jgi:hypothetical protein